MEVNLSNTPFPPLVRALDRVLAAAERGTRASGETSKDPGAALIASKAKAAILKLRDNLRPSAGKPPREGGGGSSTPAAPAASGRREGGPSEPSLYGMTVAPAHMVYANAVVGLRPTYYRKVAVRGRVLLNSVVFLFIVLFILFFYTKR